jgi:hypothetical protein
MWIDQARYCHWWWPYKGIVIASERHSSVSFDSNRRLHNENDLAVKYPDGWGVYAIHGVRVPKEYVETPADKINPVSLLKEQNAQIRMAVIGKVGFSRLLRHLKTETISKGRNGDRLISIDLGDQMIRALHLSWEEIDGRHETVLPVPTTKEDWASSGKKIVPDNLDDFEHVRLATFGWKPSQVEIVAES